MEIGAETRADEIRNLTYRNCHIIHMTGPTLGCFNVDRARVHDVLYEDITVEYDDVHGREKIQKSDDEIYCGADPDHYPRLAYVNIDYHAEYSEDQERRGENYDFTYRNIRAYGRHPLRVQIDGYDAQHQSHDILLDGIYHNDRRIEDCSELQLQLGEFAENVRLK